MTTAATLQRETFSTSRLLEFFTEKELNMQIGLERENWALALLKELVDNALDACEGAGIAPCIEIEIEGDTVSVRDNGPGIPAEVITRSLDYSIRVSDKSYYVSPTRGQLGNALKCLWAAPYVMTGDRGAIEVQANGRAHLINVQLDRIAQEPRIVPTEDDSEVKIGTFIKFGWPEIAGYQDDEEMPDFYFEAQKLLRHYSAFNPAAMFKLKCGEEIQEWTATDTGFKHWLPSELTSPHWYDRQRFNDLIAAFLAKERQGGQVRTVREFISDFRGLSGSAKLKAVTDETNLSAKMLSDLIKDGEIDTGHTEWLLSVMRDQSRPVKPSQLGPIGEEHIQHYLLNHDLVDDVHTIKYRKVEGEACGLPFIIEAAFGIYAEDRRDEPQETIVGLNWAPALKMPMDHLRRFLGEARVDRHDPVVVVAHAICPRFNFTDRGKSSLSMPAEMREAVERSIQAITKDWKAMKRRADKDDRISQRQMEEYKNAHKPQYLTVKDAAYQVMEKAYMLASGGGKYPANARQVMYAARGDVIELTGKIKPWKKSSYFTQHLLPDFIDENPDLTANWDVVFDARGHIAEPHTEYRSDLGTVEMRDYVRSWHIGDVRAREYVFLDRDYETRGPANRYKYALFIEKEGFNHLFHAARIMERYDLALMSTKGMSTTAARMLVERLSEEGVTILVLRDFDMYGFRIAHTLANDTRRYKFKAKPRVIDIGLRLKHVERFSLQSELCDYPNDPTDRLVEYGATEEEVDFLVSGRDGKRFTGERVELNALPSDVMIQWIEEELKAIGVEKVIPDEDVLRELWKNATREAKIQKAIDEAMEEAKKNDIPMPEDLAGKIREKITDKATPWDLALASLADEALNA